MEFGVLGPLLVRGARVGSRQQRRLLAALLVHAGSVVSADRLIDVLWPGKAPASAVSTMHAYVSRLRTLLPDGTLQTRPPGYVLTGADLDAARFERLVAEARAAADPRTAGATLDRALGLWRGPAYAEFADDEFWRPEAARLDELRLDAVEERFAARLAAGDTGLAGEIEAHAAAHPLRERPREQLMLALYRDGRHAGALAVYREFRDRLGDELGVEPSASLRALETAILRQDPLLEATPAAPALPVALSPLVGRAADVAAAGAALDTYRLVTLIGTGGVGKTRLALAVAAPGAAFCELAPVTAPDDVAPALATATGATQQPGRGIEESLLAFLAPRRLLLVVDNCEHVLGAAARLVDAVLRRCPGVTVLATSRTPLGIPGEHLRPVAPLPEPDAVTLFVDRARAVRPGFEPDDATRQQVTGMCRELDGLPLAIELAAARIRALNTADLAARMDDRFAVLTGPPTAPVARHRTLRSVLDWSYALLSPAEQRLLARLSVFAGGWTLDAAERVCGGDLDGLSALVDSSLTGVGPAAGTTRYTMLETVRSYGAQLLAARDEEAATRRAHAEYYTSIVQRAGQDLAGPDEGRWAGALDADFANLRAAHRWAAGAGDTDLTMRLSAGLYYYVLHQFRDEVVSWGSAALSLPGAAAHPLYATVCGAVGEGLTLRGDLPRAFSLASGALTHFDDPDDARRLPLLKVLTAVALYEGRLDDCDGLAGELLRLARDPARVADGLLFRGLARTYAGDPAAGLAVADENLVAATGTGNPTLIAWALYNQAEALAHLDPAGARERYERAAALAHSVRSLFTATIVDVGLAALLARTGETAAALTAFRRTVAAWHDMQVWHHQWTTLRNLVSLLAGSGSHSHKAAATLLAAVEAGGPPAFGADAARMASAAALLRKSLGTGYKAAVARGAAMNPDETVAFALASI